MAVDISELYKTATYGKHFQKGSRMSDQLSFTGLLQSSSNMHQTLFPLRGRQTSTSTFFPTKIEGAQTTIWNIITSKPSLLCYLLLTNPVSPLQEKAIFVKPTPKSLPFPASFRKTLTALQSTDKDHSESERARSQLRDIFFEIQFSSKLFREIQNSVIYGPTH